MKSKHHRETVSRLVSGKGESIPLFKVFMPQSILDPLKEVLFSGYVGQGPQVDEFENQLSPFFGTANVLAVNSGTSAIQLALRLANVSPGNEVISTPMTCLATNQPILAAGAKIKWADIDPWTGNIDPQDVQAKITSKTKAVMAVHWGGYPCDLDELKQICLDHGISLIEDACHAFGASYHGKPIGSHSDFVCFSFQAIKEMTTIDGGALTCKSKINCDRGRRLRWFGIDRTGERSNFFCDADVNEYGYKFHMNDIAATIGIEQIKYVGENLKRTRGHADQYNAAFSHLASVAPLHYRNDRLSSCWLYTLRVKNTANFHAWMQSAKITVSKVHTRNDSNSLFKEFRCDLPGVEEFNSEHVCIPVGWWLRPEDVSYIIENVVAFDQKTS